MKTWTVSAARSGEPVPHPERTARKNSEWDVRFQEWTSRAAMLTTIRMQGKGPTINPWRACTVHATCAACGKEIIYTDDTRKYCSDECWRAGVA